MQEDWDVIGQVMLQLVNDYFPVKELKNYMSEFIIFKMKGHFPFGQLVILHYQMLDGQSKDIFQAAAAVELMILSLDIFDDLQDQDNFDLCGCMYQLLTLIEYFQPYSLIYRSSKESLY